MNPWPIIPTDEAMFLQVGRMRYEVATLEQASLMFCLARDASGQGASQIETPMIVRQDGAVIGHVSYNGRVWPGEPQNWHSGLAPLYDNRD